jgi:NADPH2:quinone reductase
MRAVVIDRFGGADAARLAEHIAVPSPGAGEVLIAVRCAALNPADWKLREGWLRSAFVPDFPYVLGFDAAGIVVAHGEGVSGPAIGARVVAKTAVGRGGAGGLAAYVTVPAYLVCPLPDAVSFEQAATLPTAGITAWEALFDTGRLAVGQSVLINGGGGGTGSFAIQLARSVGARVSATGSPANHDYLRALGAEPTIDYRRDDLAEAVKMHFPGGVDLLIDTVGQGALARPLDCIRDGGAFVTIGTLVAGEPRPAPERGIRVETATSSREREAGQLAALVAAMADGRIASPAIEIVPAIHAAEAIEQVRKGHVRGKILLRFGPEDKR